MEEKDCKIIFLNKQTYDFSSKDLAKALSWAEGQKVWAIETPWGILQPMDKETFENVASCVFTGPSDTTIPEDLQ